MVWCGYTTCRDEGSRAAHGGTWRAQGCKGSTRRHMACTWRHMACTWRHMACAGLQRLHKAVAAPALHGSQLKARRQCERLSHVVRATERRHPVGRAVPHGAHHMGECAAQRLLGGKAKPSPTMKLYLPLDLCLPSPFPAFEEVVFLVSRPGGTCRP